MSFSQFEADLLKSLQPRVLELFGGANGPKFAEALGAFLLNEPGPQRAGSPRSAAMRYQALLLWDFSEISESYYTLRDIEIMVSALTTRKSRIAKARLLSYHVHNYLNEDYILKTRLEKFPVSVFRASKRYTPSNRRRADVLKAIVATAFSSISQVRGGHVHNRRFSDDDLDRLAMLERLSKPMIPALDGPMVELLRADFHLCKGEWLDRMRTNNDEVLKLLDVYFAALHKTVFDEAGNIRIPATIRAA